MRIRAFDSVIFHTTNLAAVRKFYSESLSLQVGIYEKDGEEVADESSTYVNFDVGGYLLCFEQGQRVDLGSVVLITPDLSDARSELQGLGVVAEKSAAKWLKIRDPDGRVVILQAPA